MGYVLNKETSLLPIPIKGSFAGSERFYPVTLWPVTVQAVDFILKETYKLDALSDRAALSWF